MAIFVKLVQALIGALLILWTMSFWKGMFGRVPVTIVLVIVAGAALRLADPVTLPFAVGTLIGVALPYVAFYGAKAYVWAVTRWNGYSKDSEGRIIVDAICVVVH